MHITVEKIKQSPLYSEELGIELGSGEEAEYFKWFLASILFGGRISEAIARKTYAAFVRYQLLTPPLILAAGLDFLICPIMREGGYVRYDNRKSTQIMRNCEMLLQVYGGSLTSLHAAAENARDLESRLLDFYGVGPVTINIFLRELRAHWGKADPRPLPIITELAARIGLDLNAFDRKTVAFARIEAGLIRHRKQLPADGVQRRQGGNC